MPKNSASALEIILDWSMSRPVWQRDALRRIVTDGKLTQDDVNDIMVLLKSEHGRGDTEVKGMPLEYEHLAINPNSEDSVRLNSLENVVGVNQIISDQILSFEKDGITIIYGGNGAGKSGYARVLKKACRARHAGKIIPNAFGASTDDKATAIMKITIGGRDETEVRWEDSDHPHPILSAISIFDRDCATIHVRDKTTVAFRPFGLDIPHELASLSTKIKDILTEERKAVEDNQSSTLLNSSWSTTTVVGSYLSSLTADSDINTFRSYGDLTEEQIERMNILANDLQRDPAKLSLEHRIYADSVNRVLKSIQEVIHITSDETFSKIKQLADSARTKRTAANLAADAAFGDKCVPGVGTDAWRTLWEAARNYARNVAYPGMPFPPVENSVCVLCHSPLDDDARERMNSFERFIRENVNAQAEIAETEYNNEYSTFMGNINHINSMIQLCKGTPFSDNNLAERIRVFLEAALTRHAALKRSLESGKAAMIPTWPPSPIQELVDLEGYHRKYADQIEVTSNPEARAKLFGELEDLRDRSKVDALLPYVDAEIKRLRYLELLDNCIKDLSTRSITALGNRIADEMITPQIQDRFKGEMDRLMNNRVQVKTIRSGGEYGSPQYQIQFISNTDAPVYGILSEGELGTVAIAAFMTELATASHKSALVFDDPVSSLDHRWRDRVAKRLVEEASVRQVIVFSHDLVFVNDILDRARYGEVKTKELTLVRDKNGTGLVTQGFPWEWGKVSERINKLKGYANSASEIYAEDSETEYRQVVHSIYSKLRATWERAIEDIAFSGVINRHRDYINTSNFFKVSAINEDDCNRLRSSYKKCSSLTDAHDPSRGHHINVPSPDEVLEDIEILENWVADLTKRQIELGHNSKN